MLAKSMPQEELNDHAFSRATVEQTAMLLKMLKIGWVIKKVVGHSTSGKHAIALVLKGTAGWLMPDGKFERADLGKKTASFDLNRLK